MAKIKDGALAGVRGRIGNLLYYEYKGMPCVRRMPRKRRELPEEMVEQQVRVAGVAALYRALKAVGLDGVWDRAGEGCGLCGYNLLVRVNSPAFSGQGKVYDFRKLRLTMGRLQLPEHLRLEEGEEGCLELRWENVAEGYPRVDGGDRLRVALMKEGRSFVVRCPEVGEWERKHCRATIRLPTGLEGYGHLFCFFEAEDGECSESFYFKLNVK